MHVQNFLFNKMMYNMLRFVIMKIIFSGLQISVLFCVVTQHLTSRILHTDTGVDGWKNSLNIGNIAKYRQVLLGIVKYC